MHMMKKKILSNHPSPGPTAINVMIKQIITYSNMAFIV